MACVCGTSQTNRVDLKVERRELGRHLDARPQVQYRREEVGVGVPPHHELAVQRVEHRGRYEHQGANRARPCARRTQSYLGPQGVGHDDHLVQAEPASGYTRNVTVVTIWYGWGDGGGAVAAGGFARGRFVSEKEKIPGRGERGICGGRPCLL